MRTGRKWVRAGKIYPTPEKIGRSYFVEEGAVCRDAVQKQRLVHRAFGHG
ncbi:MAG TPA: excisionase [Paraburkholderia sp.]|nr:excisionase [Paraburkholderia sp.]HKR46499.1 excisionase [Paraburkholderia sp.]